MRIHFNWLFALNVIIIAVAILTLICGISGAVVANGLVKNFDSRARETFDLKLRECIGGTYTEDLHKQLIKTLHSESSVGEKVIGALCRYSAIMYQMAGATCLAAMVSLFILWRLKRLYNQSEQLKV